MPRDIRYQLAFDKEPDSSLTHDTIEIRVVSSIEGPTTFRIRFAIDISDGKFTLLDDPRLVPGDPDTEVSVLVTIDDQTFCLVHGIITDRQQSLFEGGPGSWLEIQGSDRRALMDREFRATHHEGKASEIVETILDRYDFETDVDPSTVEYREDDHTLAQTCTDFDFVTQLAGDNDFHFWVDCEASTSAFGGLELTETAHFRTSPPRPEDSSAFGAVLSILAPSEPPTLKINTGNGSSNIANFELQANSEAPNQTGSILRIDVDDAAVDDTDVGAPTTEPLGDAVEPGQVRSRRLVTAGSLEEARIQNRAALNDASWSVSAHAETTAYALGTIVRAHDLIKLAGAGNVTDGQYFVKSVTHVIDVTDHKMSLELLRNALGG